MSSASQIGIFVALLTIYGVTLYLAQASISRDAGRRRAYYVATFFVSVLSNLNMARRLDGVPD